MYNKYENIKYSKNGILKNQKKRKKKRRRKKKKRKMKRKKKKKMQSGRKGVGWMRKWGRKIRCIWEGRMMKVFYG